MTLQLGLVTLCFFGLTACAGRALDLDHEAPSGPATADSDPGLPASGEHITEVWVDDLRLYWLDAGRFQSCLKADCKDTTLTYSTDAGRAAAGGGHVYWVEGWRPALSTPTAFACRADGCPTNPVAVAQDSHWLSVRASGPEEIFANQDYLYWSSDFDIYRCAASGCPTTPEVVASGAVTESLVFEGTHAYWIDDWLVGIWSAPFDGSEQPKLLRTLAEGGSLAVGGGYLYWTAQTQVYRCAIASCDATPPTLLATAESKISDLKIDDTTIYWLAAGSVHSCPLLGCGQSQVITPPQIPNCQGRQPRSFAIDASDIYWIDAGIVSSAYEPMPGKAIRRTAK